MPKRTRVEIYTGMLSLASTPVSAATLSKEMGIPYNRIGQYISPLLKNELLKLVEAEGRDMFQCTDKGFSLLAEFRKINDVMRAYGL